MPAKNLRRVTEVGTYSHVYNKGIENRIIFEDDADFQIFVSFLDEYLSSPKSPESTKKDFTVNGRVYKGIPHQPKNYFNKVELIAYSLKPDHFHLLLHQKTRKSLQGFIRSLCTRYSMYFNKKYNRTGSLFEGPYKSAIVKDEKSLLHLTRYFHKTGNYSSYEEYLGNRKTPWVRSKIVLSIKNDEGNYKDFVEKNELLKEKGLLEEIVIENINHHHERREPEKIVTKPPLRIPEFLAASAIFVVLLSLGVRNIKISQASSATLGVSSTASTSPTPSASPTPESEPKTVLTVKKTDGNVPINIRKEPTVESEKIGKARGGDKFEFVSENSDWYEVKLPDGTFGFILSTYMETGVTNNQPND